MKHAHLMGCGLLAIAVLGACGHPPEAPATGEGHLEGQLVLPPTFTNGTPFTHSTPFTNSIPLAPAYHVATAFAEAQTVEAVDPASGRVLSRARTGPDGHFALAIPAASEPVVLQAVVKDAWGRIFGLVATATRPAVTRGLTLSAGSTVAPVAGALSVGEAEGVTFGAGFAGIARPRLARALGKLDPGITEKASQRFDGQFQGASSGNALMTSVVQTADRLAVQVVAGASQDPETLGTRLGTALTLEGEAGTPSPTPSPAPTPRPKPRPTPWSGDGHAPAVPAPWPPKR
ncbi:MAG TPA: hypothetical protein V6D00_05925 [Pantanalinema sp.]